MINFISEKIYYSENLNGPKGLQSLKFLVAYFNCNRERTSEIVQTFVSMIEWSAVRALNHDRGTTRPRTYNEGAK